MRDFPPNFADWTGASCGSLIPPIPYDQFPDSPHHRQIPFQQMSTTAKVHLDLFVKFLRGVRRIGEIQPVIKPHTSKAVFPPLPWIISLPYIKSFRHLLATINTIWDTLISSLRDFRGRGGIASQAFWSICASVPSNTAISPPDSTLADLWSPCPPLCPWNWAAAKHTQIGLERETFNILPNAHKC